jgi:hypothetical protein
LTTERKFDDDQIKAHIENLFPDPKKPARADVDSRVNNLYLARVQKVKEARSQISSLRLNGKGADIKGVKESLWGTFNAILEFIDHYEKNSGNNDASNLFGTGAALKRKAYDQALVTCNRKSSTDSDKAKGLIFGLAIALHLGAQ